MKQVGYYHNKDMDGFFSGAVLKRKFPDIDLVGRDYADPLPDLQDISDNYNHLIFIDVTFPFDITQKISDNLNVTIIDHHISFKKQVEECLASGDNVNFEYIYDDKLSACEIGFRHYFGFIPQLLDVVGQQDTYRTYGKPQRYSQIIPIQYYLYGKVNDYKSIPDQRFEKELEIANMIDVGEHIMNYEKTINESKTKKYSFEKQAYGFRALCINANSFSSQMLDSKFDSSKYDIMIGFAYNGDKRTVSLRSPEGGPDVSQIAKVRGGGGHKGASGFKVDKFEDIFL